MESTNHLAGVTGGAVQTQLSWINLGALAKADQGQQAGMS